MNYCQYKEKTKDAEKFTSCLKLLMDLVGQMSSSIKI